MPYYLANGEGYSGEYHTHTDGTVGTGASHTSDSRILSTVDPGESSQNPHIRKGNSPLSHSSSKLFADSETLTLRL